MKNTIGEPPVVFDPAMTQNTVNQFQLFMHSKGYFNARVEYSDTIIKRKTNITYTITGNTPYHIRNLTYDISDPFLRDFVIKDSLNSLIKQGSRYDADEIAK
jgi:outer membrane protein insertion porin family